MCYCGNVRTDERWAVGDANPPSAILEELRGGCSGSYRGQTSPPQQLGVHIMVAEPPPPPPASIPIIYIVVAVIAAILGGIAFVVYRLMP